jgi:predicted ATPase
MDLYSIIESGGNVKLEVKAQDLVKFAEVLIEKSQEVKAREMEHSATAEKYLTTEEAAEMCKVGKTTLWAWDKAGYLKASKLGKRKYYALSDIKRLLNEKENPVPVSWRKESV